jgi:hypothetical protein
MILRRRKFITLIGGAAVWPLAARAQQSDRIRLIGVLMGFAESDREGQVFIAAFREGLQRPHRDAGYLHDWPSCGYFDVGYSLPCPRRLLVA